MAVVTSDPGNFAIVLGDEDAKRKLRRVGEEVDDWLYEIADDSAHHAADRLRINSPGGIDRLVDTRPTFEVDPGDFIGVAGVTPDTVPMSRQRGIDSDPADYPIFVDQGTGIYGANKSPILATPGNLMGPIRFNGRTYFVPSFKGQPAQHFSESSFVDTVAWIPARVELALPELSRRIET